jgi:hypothetical protein
MKRRGCRGGAAFSGQPEGGRVGASTLCGFSAIELSGAHAVPRSSGGTQERMQAGVLTGWFVRAFVMWLAISLRNLLQTRTWPRYVWVAEKFRKADDRPVLEQQSRQT